MQSDGLDPRWDDERRDLVDTQLRRRGIHDERVLQAFLAIPRHRFLPPAYADQAYEDHPVSIGHGQTISQPYMVAWMTQELALAGGERVLEIGTGSGYQTALLARLAAQVYTVERIAELSTAARELLGELGVANVHFHVGDGTLGWAEEAPFDRILVTAGAPKIPPSLLEQLAEGGRLAMPVGGRGGQEFILVEKRGGKEHRRHLGGCVFVPLVGKEGWPES